MVDPDFPRDLALTAAILGFAAFVWSGWAQEKPPPRTAWRVLLAGLSLVGLVLAGIGAWLAVLTWDTVSAIAPGTVGFVVYLVAFWVEFIAASILAFIVIRRGRSDLVAPIVLAIVGIHFFALAPAFGQPFLFVPAVLLTGIAAVAGLAPAGEAARSYWCGVLAAPVFLATGAWAAIVVAANLSA